MIRHLVRYDHCHSSLMLLHLQYDLMRSPLVSSNNDKKTKKAHEKRKEKKTIIILRWRHIVIPVGLSNNEIVLVYECRYHANICEKKNNKNIFNALKNEVRMCFRSMVKDGENCNDGDKINTS